MHPLNMPMRDRDGKPRVCVWCGCSRPPGDFVRVEMTHEADGRRERGGLCGICLTRGTTGWRALWRVA